jgi:hypothetical protein
VTSLEESNLRECPGFAFFEFCVRESIEPPIEIEKLISGKILVEISILWHESNMSLYARISW